VNGFRPSEVFFAGISSTSPNHFRDSREQTVNGRDYQTPHTEALAMPETATRAALDSVKDSTVYWFVKMENALERGDLESAFRAQQQLKRLGLSVEYTGLKREAADGHR
jgi:hypothetical protein